MFTANCNGSEWGTFCFMKPRSGADSRCSHPENAPYKWVFDYDSANERVKELDDWLNGLDFFARNHYLGEIDGLLEDAAAGKIANVGHTRSPIKPVRVDPDLYELRLQVLQRKLRFYHAEPLNHPTVLVKLHKHIKRTWQDGNVSWECAKRDQDEQMEFAVSRYRIT